MEAFTDEQRSLFEAHAEVLQVSQGELLLRRGDPGGDLFYLAEGMLEAVDTRSSPEVVLAIMKPGTVVGEMSFVDGSPRSVDVRVSTASRVLRWAQRDLRALLRREPIFAAVFYESVAQLASTRMRRLTQNTMTGSLTAGESDGEGDLEAALGEAERLARSVKASLLRCETLLRESPEDVAAEGALRDELFSLQERIGLLMTSWPNPLVQEAASEVLQRELHPYLVRSALADRCIRRPQGVTATPEILSQVYVNHPSGEGRLGQILDSWLLERPTLNALRGLSLGMPFRVGERLVRHRNRRIIVLNAGTGSLVARLGQLIDLAPTHITVMDGSRSALSLLDTDVAPMDHNVTIEAVQQNLAELALGRSRRVIPMSDSIVIHGLFEYLPDRLAVGLLRTCAGWLNLEGHLYVATLSESIDADLFDRLLGWPTIRRSEATLQRLFHAAGLSLVASFTEHSPGLLVVGRRLAPEQANR